MGRVTKGAETAQATARVLSGVIDDVLDMAREMRLKRAREQGFDTDTVYYHGTKAGDISEFDVSKSGQTNPSARGIAAFVSDNPATANTYTGSAADSGAIYPVYVRRGKQAEYDFGGNRWNDYPLDGRDTNMLAQDAMDEGYNSVLFKNVLDHGDDIPHILLRQKFDELYGTNISALDPGSEEYWNAVKDFDVDSWAKVAEAVRRDLSGSANNMAVFRPEDIRSINAAFDPAKTDSPNLLAGGAAAAVGLGAATGSEDADAGVITKGGKRIIEAFHGSPHKFDRFSMQNIGTGEGAQAYGHGLYFADSKDVAESYRATLTRPKSGDIDGNAADLVRLSGGEQEAVEFLRQADTSDPLIQASIDSIQTGRYKDWLAENGATYRVHLDVDPDTLLDWDRPFPEQPANVQAGLESALADDEVFQAWRANGALDKVSGQILYRRVVDRAGPAQGGTYGAQGSQQGMATQRLREAGIPGIRYADGMSRGKSSNSPNVLGLTEDDKGLWRTQVKDPQTGEVVESPPFTDASGAEQWASQRVGDVTYNYVMFDDAPISIQERGMATPEMLAATAMASAAAAFTQRRSEKQGYWEQKRAELMQTINNAANFSFGALEMPWRGILGATRMAGGLAAGEGFDAALQSGVQQIRQPLEDTAYNLGGTATDATGSPAIGTAVNTAIQMGGPI